MDISILAFKCPFCFEINEAPVHVVDNRVKCGACSGISSIIDLKDDYLDEVNESKKVLDIYSKGFECPVCFDVNKAPIHIVDNKVTCRTCKEKLTISELNVSSHHNHLIEVDESLGFECPVCFEPNLPPVDVEYGRVTCNFCKNWFAASKSSQKDHNLIDQKLTVDETLAAIEMTFEEFLLREDGITFKEFERRSTQVDSIKLDQWTTSLGNSNDQMQYVQNGFWKKLKRNASEISFVRDAVAMYYCALDPNTPLKAKATAVAALAYFILPIDAIPDIIPVVGFTDDAGAILLALNNIRTHITDEHRQQAEDWLLA